MIIFGINPPGTPLMRKQITLCCLALVLMATYGCSKSSVVAGEYEVAPKTLNDYLFLHKMDSRGRIVGSQLKLNPDSTFTYITCGNEMKGTWRQAAEAVLLHVSTNTYRASSLKSSQAPIIPKEPIEFFLHKGQLYRYWPRGTPDSARTIELLTKKE